MPVTNVNEQTDILGNRGAEIFGLLENTTDKQTTNELETELENIKATLITHGIPTVEEYDSDKAYWRQITAQHHLSKEKDQ